MGDNVDGKFEYEAVTEEEKIRAAEAVEQFEKDMASYEDVPLSDEDIEKFNSPWGPRSF